MFNILLQPQSAEHTLIFVAGVTFPETYVSSVFKLRNGIWYASAKNSPPAKFKTKKAATTAATELAEREGNRLLAASMVAA